MSTETECRWQWGKPDKPGLWYWGGTDETPLCGSLLTDVSKRREGWWGYCGPIPPEPLPPKKKITQTMWMVPVKQRDENGYFSHWMFSDMWCDTDDTIPPGAIQTVLTREVEQ